MLSDSNTIALLYFSLSFLHDFSLVCPQHEFEARLYGSLISCDTLGLMEYIT
jgi:hypothetical protein